MACPTCEGSGPDVVTIDFDTGWPEYACGDEWHDALNPTPDSAEVRPMPNGTLRAECADIRNELGTLL